MYFYFQQIKFNLINHHFRLELIDSGLRFVQDENNFIYPLLQVGYGVNEKSNGSGRPRNNGSGSSNLVEDKKKLLIILSPEL